MPPGMVVVLDVPESQCNCCQDMHTPTEAYERILRLVQARAADGPPLEYRLCRTHTAQAGRTLT